jgi:hypothetical protein
MGLKFKHFRSGNWQKQAWNFGILGVKDRQENQKRKRI